MFAEQKQIIDAELSTLSTMASSTSPSSSTATSGISSTTSASIATSTSSAPSATDTTTNDHHSISFSTGALAGGIVAIILVIAILAAFLFWLFNKNRKQTLPKLETQPIENNESLSTSGDTFRKAELDSSSSRFEMDSSSLRRELDGSCSSRKSKFSARELEGNAAHVFGESSIYEMDAGPPDRKFVLL
jgi:uncharacterized protein HemX